MTKDQVLYYRNQIYQLDVTVPNEDGSTSIIKTPIKLMTDTNISQWLDMRDGSIIWNDDKELVLAFYYNSDMYNDLTTAVSPGNRPKAPVYYGALPYDSIVSMRAVLLESTFFKIMDILGLNANEQKAMYHKFFVETDQEYIIKRKQQIGYSTQHSKEYMKDKSYDEFASYLKTVHAQSL